jgi:hypothetical protein
MAAPTLIDYQEAAWSTTTTPKDSPSISWQAGDVIVVILGCASTDIPALPTATGLTFVSQQTNGVGCGTRCAAVVAGGSGSSVVSSSVTGGDVWGFGVWVWRNSAGIGNSAIVNGAETVSLTASAVNAGIVWGSFDFVAAATATIVPTPSNTREITDHGTTYTTHVADLVNQTSGGAVSYGTSGGGGQYTVVAFEVKASVGGISFVTSGGATVATAASTWSFVPGGSSMVAGSAIIVGVGVGSSVVTVSTMTDNTTNLYLKAIARGSPKPAAGAELWYALGYSTASTRVSVTLSGSASGGIAYADLTGLSTLNALGPTGSSGNSTNSTVHSITEVTSTSTGALVISFNRVNVSTISPITKGADYTMWISTGTVVRCFGEYWIQSAASTATSPWQTSSGCLFSGVQAVFYDTVTIAAGGGDYYSPGGFALLGLQR